MPERWRARLAHAFWRPHAFAQELATLSRPHDGQSLPLAPEELTPEGLLKDLHARGISFIGERRPEEIVKRLRRQGGRRERDAAVQGNRPAYRGVPSYRRGNARRFRCD